MNRSLRNFCVLCVSAVNNNKALTTETQRTQKLRRGVCLVLLVAMLVPSTVQACGPETIEPVFTFIGSPDPPFDEFAKGRIGILRATFGRKTLVIAHRYLEGGTYTEDEQHALIDALKGKAPEEQNDAAIKAWIDARKLVLPEEKSTPAIYDERRHTGYDFFPNCTSNAFEVATQTLKDRVTNYGSDDANVRDWLQAQDVVFKNCAEGSEAPAPASTGSPRWLQKDRDYQIAASFFYTLNFVEAHSRFEKISQDADSEWQEVAAYLIGRTLVRQASLTANQKEKRVLYEQAERELLNQTARGGKFQNAANRLLGLVKYRLHPEERVRELAQTLQEQSGNENLRQDLIDYTWLLDKFDQQVQAEEEERKRQANPPPAREPYKRNEEYEARYEAIQRGEMIELYFTARDDAGKPNYGKSISLYRNYDVTEAEVFQDVEVQLGRKLSPEETKDLKSGYSYAISRRQWLLSPNRKFDHRSEYDGCDEHCNNLLLASLPTFLRADELTDWILTFQSNDERAFSHSVSRWRKTQSPAWLAIALTKATKVSSGLNVLMAEGEKIAEESPAYATIAYQLVRLRLELDRGVEARKLLDKIIATQFDSLPVSSQNLFLEQRIKLSSTVDEFLRFAVRKPVTFYYEGSYGPITDLVKIEKSNWDAAYNSESKEEFDRYVDERYKRFLPWDERKAFDPDAAELFNWHFSLSALLDASRSSELPEYLRRSLVLAVWTRAVLLKNDQIAREVTPEVSRLVPEMSPLLDNYLKARTKVQRDSEALYLMLKFPNLSPYVPDGIPEFSTAEEAEYYFELSWWCKPDETEYHSDGTEARKVVAAPRFLPPQSTGPAKKEREVLIAIGDAKSFLGKQVLEWARRAPDDPRVPEALYIAAQANQMYRYGCGSYEGNEETRAKLETLLKERYPNSSWAVKLIQETE